MIVCIYDDEKSPPREERLHPLKIVNYEVFWYFVALDDNEYVRKSYLKQVSNVQVTDECFETSSEIDEMLKNSINVWFQSDRELFVMLLHADEKIAKIFFTQTTSHTENNNSDGSLELIVTITYKMELLQIVQYWLPYLRVISPNSLDDLVRDSIKKCLNEGK